MLRGVFDGVQNALRTWLDLCKWLRWNGLGYENVVTSMFFQRIDESSVLFSWPVELRPEFPWISTSGKYHSALLVRLIDSFLQRCFGECQFVGTALLLFTLLSMIIASRSLLGWSTQSYLAIIVGGLLLLNWKLCFFSWILLPLLS